MLAITITEGAALVLLSLLVVGLLRSHAEILRTLHEMGAGQPQDRQGDHRSDPQRKRASDVVGGTSRDLSGETLDGEAVAIGVVGAPHDTLLAFLSASCYTCQPFWSALSGPVDIPNQARVIAVVQRADSATKLRSLAGPDLLVVISDAAWSDYQVPGSPHFVYVDGPSGRIVGEGTAPSWPQVRDLLGQAMDGRGPTGQHNGGRTEVEPNARDNAGRVDLELLKAGIGPGHHSLYEDIPAKMPDGHLRSDS
jgi:hypothetical protein